MIERAGVPCRCWPAADSVASALRAALAADRIDVVHAWLFIANAFSWAATRFAPTARHLGAQPQAPGRLLDTLNRRAFAASAGIIVNSRQVRDYIADAYGAPARTTVVYNAIDLNRQPPIQLRPTHPRVAMVGGWWRRRIRRRSRGGGGARERLPSVRFAWL